VLPINTFAGANAFQAVLVEHGAGLTEVRLDSNTYRDIATGSVQGSDAVLLGSVSVLAYAQGGTVRLKYISGGAWAGGNGTADLGGPPRTGYSAPYPVPLNADLSCEAAWPRLAFVNETLVVTWQERCAPATQWKVMARVVR
jgi:hypothetical protein